MFERVLIANRGEIVARIARTLLRLGCSPAAIHVHGDGALHALAACDVTVELDSYLDADAIVRAARSVNADAIHPGYGFLSERTELARACEAAGIVWIGPPVSAIELMADKAAARALATRAGLPVVPGLEDPTPAAVAAFAQEHGLPLLVKPARGGGGKGMRVISSLEDLATVLDAARREAATGTGSEGLIVERQIAPARHLELQLLADAEGTVIDFGERECSLQRRHQKVVEETPSPAVDEALRATLRREAVALARACGYVGAGTVEFVAHAEQPARHYFLEMNTRLQVEHAITEAVYGIDLVEWQVRIAAGDRLDSSLPTVPRGHAVEARIYAEDPARGFLPAAGVVRALHLPRATGIRVDCGIAAGEAVGERYDPMVAKVIAHAPTRAQALTRLRSALRDTTLLGVRTNVGFLCDLLEDERVREGRIDTTLVERIEVAPVAAGAAHAALVASVAQSLCDRSGGDATDPFVTLAGWRLTGAAALIGDRLAVDGELEVELALGALSGVGGAAVAARIDGTPCAVAVLADERAGDGRRLRVAIDGIVECWTAAPDGDAWWIGRDGQAWRIARSARDRDAEAGGERDVRAPMPGSVVAVHVLEGAEVARGALLLVMESMKMELQITAPRNGTVAAINVSPGEHVALDAVLASIESDHDSSAR